MHRVRPAYGRRSRFAEPQVPDLAGEHELRHRPDGLLDGHGTVDTVLVVQVDGVDIEAAQRCVARPVHVLGPAVDGLRSVGLALEPELRRDHVLVAPPREGSADQLLVRERPVHVGRVEQGDAELGSAIDRRDRLCLVTLLGGPVEVGHAHAAEPDRRDLEPLSPERAMVHVTYLCRCPAFRSPSKDDPWGRPHAI